MHDLSPLTNLHPETHIATGVTVGLIQTAVATLSAELEAVKAELAATEAELDAVKAELEGHTS
jgi:hypothetical protein